MIKDNTIRIMPFIGGACIINDKVNEGCRLNYSVCDVINLVTL